VFYVVGTMVMRLRRLTGMSHTTPIDWLPHVPDARRSRDIRSAGISSPVPNTFSQALGDHRRQRVASVMRLSSWQLSASIAVTSHLTPLENFEDALR
jgi:hypothetical protein